MPTFRSLVPPLLKLAILALLILYFPAPTAHANPGIIRVTQNATATWTCGGSADWSNPCPLQTALANAVSGDQIWVASGTYTPGTNRTDTFTLRAGVAIYGGFAGNETARSQRNITTNLTTLSGDIGVGGDTSDNAYHVVSGGSGLTATAVLDGFTVTGGSANLTDGANDRGGGMYNSGGSPTLTNVTFTSNSAYYYGGGMYNVSGSPTLTNVTFTSNSANYGGGMFELNGSPPLTNVTFTSNSLTTPVGCTT